MSTKGTGRETPRTDAATSHCVCNATTEEDVVPRSTALALETSNRSLLAALKGLLEANEEYQASIREAAKVGNKPTPRANKAAEAFDAAWVTARQTAAAEPKAEGKG